MKTAEDTVRLQISGNGCVLTQVALNNFGFVCTTNSIYVILQAVLTYYVNSFLQKPAFNITVKNEIDSENQRCIDTKLTTCVVYNKLDEESNMVVMEIAIPSGFRADEQSLSLYLEKNNQANSIKLKFNSFSQSHKYIHFRNQKI